MKHSHITLMIPIIFSLLMIALGEDVDPGVCIEYPAVSDEERVGVRVMSYNIRFDNPEDGIDAWPNREENVSHLIQSEYRPDLIGMQEALLHQIESLEQLLDGYKWVGTGRSDGFRGGEFSPVFYNASKFDLLQTRTFWLSNTPEIPGSKSWDAAIPRIVTWVKFRDKKTGMEFYQFNTHLDHIGIESRKESVKLLLKKIGEIAGSMPFLITGDFNVTEESEVYEILRTTEGIADARYSSATGHSGPTASFNNWTELREAESRIDYIFASKGVDVLCHRLVDNRYDGRFPSDHLPVVADVLLPVN